MANRLLDYKFVDQKGQILDSPQRIGDFLAQWGQDYAKEFPGKNPQEYLYGPAQYLPIAPGSPIKKLYDDPRGSAATNIIAANFFGNPEAFQNIGNPDIIRQLAADPAVYNYIQNDINTQAADARSRDSGNIFSKALKNIGTFASAATGLGAGVGGLGALLTGGSVLGGAAAGAAGFGNALGAATGVSGLLGGGGGFVNPSGLGISPANLYNPASLGGSVGASNGLGLSGTLGAAVGSNGLGLAPNLANALYNPSSLVPTTTSSSGVPIEDHSVPVAPNSNPPGILEAVGDLYNANGGLTGLAGDAYNALKLVNGVSGLLGASDAPASSGSGGLLDQGWGGKFKKYQSPYQQIGRKSMNRGIQTDIAGVRG